MAISVKQVEQVAYLARLKLTDQEKELFAEQLSLILEYANKLNELNTDQVEPLYHVSSVYNVFREDQVKPSTPQDEILANAPLVEDGQYKVPRII